MTQFPRWIAVFLMLCAVLVLRPGLRGDTARTEDIIKSIISGGGPGKESIAPEFKPESNPEPPFSLDEKLSQQKNDGSQSKKKTDMKGVSSAEEALYKTGIDFFNSEMYEQAIQSFNEIKSSHPQSQQMHGALLYTGKARLRLRDYKKAMEDFKAIPPESGEFPASLFYQGEASIGLGRPTEAIILYHRVAGQFPQTALADDSLIRASSVFLESGKGYQALEAAVSVIRRYPDRDTVDDAYFMIAQVYEKDPKLRDVEVSRKVYRAFIRKADAGEDVFKNSPLLRRVRRELRMLENRYFRYEK